MYAVQGGWLHRDAPGNQWRARARVSSGVRTGSVCRKPGTAGAFHRARTPD